MTAIIERRLDRIPCILPGDAQPAVVLDHKIFRSDVNTIASKSNATVVMSQEW